MYYTSFILRRNLGGNQVLLGNNAVTNNVSFIVKSRLLHKSWFRGSLKWIQYRNKTFSNFQFYNINLQDEFCSAQTSFDTIIDEEIPNLCLKTSSTTARYTRGNKQTSKNLNKTSTTPLKRSNSVINSEHSSKKKKIEKPSSNVERKTTTNNDVCFY